MSAFFTSVTVEYGYTTGRDIYTINSEIIALALYYSHSDMHNSVSVYFQYSIYNNIS